MFNQFNPQINIDRLKRQKEEIENMIQNYQNMPQQQPINNIINTQQPQTVQNNLVEWRILNENEEVDNLYVSNKTLFVGDKNMILKGVDGKLEKWEIKRTYPIDEKDKKIEELEKQIQELKGMIKDEYTKPNKSNASEFKSDGNDDEYAKSKSKNNIK